MLSVNIFKRLGSFELNARFESLPSGVTALFGRSGAGKTSVLNMVAGIESPDRGFIHVNGRTLYDSEKRISVPIEKRGVGFVFQDSLLFPHMSVRKNLEYGMKEKHGRKNLADFDHVAQLLGLEKLLDRKPRGLSGGERQRVAIGRALLSNPAILLMDEPLSAIDHGRKEEIIPFIEKLRDEKILPIIYVSHSADEVARLADTVVLMENGSVSGAAAPVMMERLFDCAASFPDILVRNRAKNRDSREVSLSGPRRIGVTQTVSG